MKINNNFNNNKQVNFKADLKCFRGVSETLALRLAKVVKEIEGTEGDIVTLKQDVFSHPFHQRLESYNNEFEYFKKGSTFSDEQTSVSFTTLNRSRFDMWESGAEKSTVKNIDEEEKDNKIVEFFQKFMDSMSRK